MRRCWRGNGVAGGLRTCLRVTLPSIPSPLNTATQEAMVLRFWDEERVARAVWAVRERTRSSGEREGERERGEAGGEDAFVSWGIHD